ncbi:MAG: gliding motility-associated C-terminal domain-containing protein [Flavobacteriales bacterium]
MKKGIQTSFAPAGAQLLVSFVALCCWGIHPMSSQSILNGSFEQMDAPPNNSGQWSLVQHWTNAGSATADPDAYHLDGSLGGDLPETPVAMVQPYHARGVMGIRACGLPGTNEREYLRGQFSEPLQPGMRYAFSFFITNGELTPLSQAGLGASGLGIAFSNGVEQQIAGMPLTVDPTFRMSSILYDEGWREIEFVFTAVQQWTHFTFGMFGSDDWVNIEYRSGTNPQFAYYFVDRFGIQEAPQDMESAQDEGKGPAEESDRPSDGVAGAGWFVPNAFTPNHDGENDRFLPVVEEDVEVKQFDVYNRWGQVVWSWHPGELGWNGMMAGGSVRAEMGVYIWKMVLKKPGSRPIEQSGQLTLIR